MKKYILMDSEYCSMGRWISVIAEARLNNFEMPLSELAEEIGIGRSAANYRLRKLCEMAEDIRTEMPD